MELVATNSMPEECVTTLYDIVSVINQEEIANGDVDKNGEPKTRHRNAMKVIEKLAEEPSFGTPLKISVVSNNRGQTTETYAFSEKQAIAAVWNVKTGVSYDTHMAKKKKEPSIPNKREAKKK